MSIVEQFRQKMAEQGKELTPAEAKNLYKIARQVIKEGKSLSQMDLYFMEKDESFDPNMSPEKKKELVELYQHVRELF